MSRDRGPGGPPEGTPCFECDAPAHHLHHVVPFSRGGRRTAPLCEVCHGKVHGLDLDGHGALIRGALAVKQAKGEMTGAPPYGYRSVPGAERVRRNGGSKPVAILEPDPAEQETLARARALSDGGMSVRAVIAALAAEGRLSRRGTPFSVASMHKMLTSEQ